MYSTHCMVHKVISKFVFLGKRMMKFDVFIIGNEKIPPSNSIGIMTVGKERKLWVRPTPSTSQR